MGVGLKRSATLEVFQAEGTLAIMAPTDKAKMTATEKKAHKAEKKIKKKEAKPARKTEKDTSKPKHVKKNEKKEEKTARKIEKQKGLSADEKKAKKEKMEAKIVHKTRCLDFYKARIAHLDE